jgi:predicted GIY-YIG superfamily endonuclease
MHYVYLLKCNDGSIYTGCTQDLEERLTRHRNGEVHYTKDKLPVELITYIAFSEKYKAFLFKNFQFFSEICYSFNRYSYS